MQLYVDDNEVASDAITGGTVEDALRHVQSALCAPGHMVVALRCDGKNIPPGEMASALREPAAAFKRLDLLTSTRAALVIDAMTQALASLDDTVGIAQEVADLLNEGKTTESREALGACVGIWQKIHEAIDHSIRMLDLDPQQTTVGDETLIDLIAVLKDVLLQIKEALKAKDDVMLADILRYEFEDASQKWRVAITRLHQEAEEHQEADKST